MPQTSNDFSEFRTPLRAILLNFDPARAPVSPRDAATVLVLRNSDRGLQVFCVLRHKQSSFLGGAVVLPGGKVDPADASDTWATLGTDPHPRGSSLATEPDGVSLRTLTVAACRETLEEAAILPTVDRTLFADEAAALSQAVRA